MFFKEGDLTTRFMKHSKLKPFCLQNPAWFHFYTNSLLFALYSVSAAKPLDFSIQLL